MRLPLLIYLMFLKTLQLYWDYNNTIYAPSWVLGIASILLNSPSHTNINNAHVSPLQRMTCQKSQIICLGGGTEVPVPCTGCMIDQFIVCV
jgi:hypothetical protein